MKNLIVLLLYFFSFFVHGQSEVLSDRLKKLSKEAPRSRMSLTDFADQILRLIELYAPANFRSVLTQARKTYRVYETSINLRFEHYYQSYPLGNYYTDGKHFLTVESPYTPPFYIRDQYLNLLQEKN